MARGPRERREPRGWRGRLAAWFKRGLAPRELAECLVLGVALGVTPLYGISTPALTLAAHIRRLNFPAIQAINWLMAGPQLALWLPFMRLGEWLCGSEPLAVAPRHLAQRLCRDFPLFVSQFSLAVVHAGIGWIVIGLPLVWGFYALLAAAANRYFKIAPMPMAWSLSRSLLRRRRSASSGESHDSNRISSRRSNQR
jgi:hypothetical protein